MGIFKDYGAFYLFVSSSRLGVMNFSLISRRGEKNPTLGKTPTTLFYSS
jgi:hypothetical protein